MTTTRRGKGTAAGATVNASHHVMGLVAQSPLMLIFLIIGLGIAVWIFTLAQITNTEQSVFGLLQVSPQLAPGMTGAQGAAIHERAHGLLQRHRRYYRLGRTDRSAHDLLSP